LSPSSAINIVMNVDSSKLKIIYSTVLKCHKLKIYL
jgi:hypothetical protein